MLIVGENEKSNGTISVRRRHKGDLGANSIDVFLEDLLEEINNRRRN